MPRNSPDTIQALQKALAGGKLVLFCGAGISRDYPCCLPSFKEYKTTVIDIMADLLPKKEQKGLKKYIRILKERSLPPEVFMQKIYSHWGRKTLDMTDIFGDKQIEPNNNHKTISALTRQGLRIILTTNFDRLIESEFPETGVKVIEDHSAFKAFSEQIHTNNLPDLPVVIKLHGSAGNHDRIVVTLNQEGRLNKDIHTLMTSLLERYTFLFLGYSGRDLDLFPTILGASKNEHTQPIYWVFYPKSRFEEDDIRHQLQHEYQAKFHAIDKIATDLLRELLHNGESGQHSQKKGKCDESKKRWKELIRERIQEKINEVDIRRIYSIFAVLAGYLNERLAEENFENAAWKANKEAEDHTGMAHIAIGVVSLYKNLQAASQSLHTFDRKIDYWLEQARLHAESEDHFAWAGIATEEGILASERNGNVEQAIKWFQRAIKHYSMFKSEDPNERDQLIGQTYINMVHSIIKSIIPNQVDLSTIEQAIDYLKIAEEHLDRSGALNNFVELYLLLGQCYRFKKQFENAKEVFDKALKIATAIHDEHGQAQVHHALCLVYCSVGNLETAKDHLDKSYMRFKKVNNEIGIHLCEELMTIISPSKDYIDRNDIVAAAISGRGTFNKPLF
jgi:tetratricopeptide (TPR) repeat protein